MDGCVYLLLAAVLLSGKNSDLPGRLLLLYCSYYKGEFMSVLILNSIRQMQDWSEQQRREGKSIGCVPTMGFLHQGHASLIRSAASQCDCVVTTVFVNPTQFAPGEDFTRYPRDPDGDLRTAEEAGTTVLFLPTTDEMYPPSFDSYITVGGVTEKFEGVFRPTHFRGVATVVAKLLLAVKPHKAFFGQKDYQQTLVVKKLVRDLNIDTQIIIEPTIRELDNLAMSSRNVYLSEEHRTQSIILSRALAAAADCVAQGERRREFINKVMMEVLCAIPTITIDYCAAARAESLEEPEVFESGEVIVCLLAVKLGSTRLIDNALLTVS